MTTRSIFRDPDLQEQMIRLGYVHIPGFLNAQELDGLRRAYQEYDPGISRRYYSTIDSYDPVYKHHVNVAIRTAASRSAERVLADYRPLTGNFVIKRKGRKSKVHMHFDISCIDEEQMESCVLWMPLADVTEANGALQMMPGSHRFMNKIRGPGVRRYYEPLYSEFERHWMKVVPMKAGDALLFINRLLHYSPPNQDSETRVAARIDFIPREADALMYYWRPGMLEQDVAVYHIEDDFYEHFRKEQEPLGASFVGYRSNRFRELSRSELLSRIQQGQFVTA